VRTLIALFVLFAAVPALGATVTCTLPNDNVTRATELCDELRKRLRVRSSEWDNNICASQFLRIGLLDQERRTSRNTAREAVANDVSTALNDFKSTWAVPTAAICGDGTLDTEAPFLEECDDGNNTDGDGCDSACVSE
jgi:cysteine-rich repeat protein